MTPDRVALYLRVSTREQSIDGQERELREEAARRGWSVATVFREKVSARGTVPRTEYDRLICEAASPDRAWAHLMVWSLDRFSRETFTKAAQSVLDLERVGIRFPSLKEPIVDTPEDGLPAFGRDAMLALLPVIASFESRRRSERVRLALAEIKAGRRTARGKLGQAFKVDLRSIRKAEALRKQGKTWNDVARSLGIKCGTIRSACFKSKRGLRAFPEVLVPGVPSHPGEPAAVQRPGGGRLGNGPETCRGRLAPPRPR